MGIAACRFGPWAVLNVLGAIGILIPASTFGFESDEHEKMGNVAFVVALEYFRETHPKSQAPYAEAARLKGRPGKYQTKGDEKYRDISYGDIVACVDYFLFPEKILADSWKEGRRSLEAGSLPTPLEKLLDLKSCHGFGNEFARATHNNHSHFQSDLLMSYRIYHLAAISAARNEGNVFAALVINAVADHYLHDFFAPGHIFTPRDRLTDVPATAVHDLRNDLGANFTPANIEQLRPIIEFICQGTVEHCRLRKDLHLEEIACEPCQTEVAEALMAILDGKPIHLRGDRRLWEQDADQLRQRLLMLLVQTRSILDVLIGGNSFQRMVWEGKNSPTRVDIGFGEYLLTEATKESKSAAQSGPPEEPLFYRLPMYQILGISMHRESMFGGARSGRNVVTFETPLTVFFSGKSANLMPMVGYGRHFEKGGVSGGGFTFRAVYAIPQTELALGPYWRFFSYPSDEGDKRRLSTGFRVDSGFSGYFTIFISIGRDTATTPDGKLRNGLISAGGIQFSLPRSRVLPR